MFGTRFRPADAALQALHLQAGNDVGLPGTDHMSKLSSLTLAAALLTTLALPAMAQGTVHSRSVVRQVPRHAVHKAVAPNTPASSAKPAAASN